MTEKLEKWLELYNDAVSKRQAIDLKIARRNELYKGTAQPINPKTGNIADKKTDCSRNMCFELIETQINNAIPQPKVTPRDPEERDLASDLEGYLQMESDRISSEEINDSAERSTYKQGTTFYLVGWDELQSTPTTSGEIFVKNYPLDKVYPQPGITDIKDAEYIFVKDLVSVKTLNKIYHKNIPEGESFKGMNTLITVYYLNERGILARFGWIEGSDLVVFDEEDYELRKVKVCAECGTKLNGATECPLCHSHKYNYVTQEMEVLQEDIVEGDPSDPQSMRVIAAKGTEIPYYKIKQLPFVMRKNISDDEGLYGVSDIDLLEHNQITMNKLLTKMAENVLKAGSIVTTPKGVNIPNNDETLKIVKISDPNQMKAFSVQTVQANMQQDDILQMELYQMGRDSLGITDSYQGKRDTTAESGKAKQVSAAQAAGRMESKRRMKDAAYADLYQLMFKFLLAYCDEKRKYSKELPNGDMVEGSFSRFNYLRKDEVTGELYYNDRFLFSVDDASTLATNRAALWQETTANLQAGALGNPADPQTLLLYWTMMKGLNYPLATVALKSLKDRAQGLPPELEQAILQNPQILQTVQQVLSNPEKYEDGGSAPNENNQQ